MNSMGVCRSDTPIEQNVKKNIEKKSQLLNYSKKLRVPQKKALKIYDAHLPMSLRDVVMRFCLRQKKYLRHRPLCGLFFLTLRVKLFFNQTHGVISSKMPQNPFYGFLRPQSIQRGGSSCANSLRVTQSDFEAAKITDHPRPTDCPLEGAQSQGD